MVMQSGIVCCERCWCDMKCVIWCGMMVCRGMWCGLGSASEMVKCLMWNYAM